MYHDDNHKPEMAVTLSDFEALCGFRAFPEIVWHLNFYPELRALVSVDAMQQARSIFRWHVMFCGSFLGTVLGQQQL